MSVSCSRMAEQYKPRSQTTWDDYNPVTPPSDGLNYKHRTHSATDAAINTMKTTNVASPNSISVFYDDSSFFSDDQKGSNNVNEEMQKEINEFLLLYQEKMKKWETSGTWTEVRETLTGKIMWYNTNTTRLVFDTPPGVEILNSATIAEKIGTNSINGYNNNSIQNEEKEYYLNRLLSPQQNEDIVGSLLQIDNDLWNFNYNNINVYNYRLSASKRDHSKMLPSPEQYVFPEYFSLAPLPQLLANKFLARIILPKEFSANKQYSLVQVKNDITKASDIIKAGVSKLDPPFKDTENPKDFIIKIVGQEAYMYGKKHVIEYEAVRHALRNEDDVEFALIKRTDFHQRCQEAKQEQKKYCQQFNTAYDNILTLCQPSKRSTLSNKTTTTINDDNDNEYKYDGDPDMNITVELPASSISLYEFEWHYRLKIEGLTNVTSLFRFDQNIIKSVYVEAEIWCGDMLLSSATLRTTNASPKPNIRWGNWLSSQNQLFSQLPREAILCLMVYGAKSQTKADKENGATNKKWFGGGKKDKTDDDSSPICLSWVRLPLIAQDNKLRKGKYLLNMWPLPKKDTFNQLKDKPFRYRGTTVDKNIKSLDAEQCQLLVAFDEHPFDVIAPKYSTLPKESMNSSNNKISNYGSMKQLDKKQKIKIEEIIKKSPIKQLEIFEKQMIWNYRDNLWHRPEALSAFVRSTNWTNVIDIQETHKYLDIWASPKLYQDAIEFLDYKYMDRKLREKAVEWLNEMDDTDLQRYLLQLIQCLKFELHHENALALFLLKRALKSPYQIGHYFFWHLKSEYDIFIEYHERFGLYLEEYLLFSCGHATQLFVQNAMLKRLEWINKKITAIPEKKRFTQETKKFFKKELYKVNHDLPSQNGIPFQIPLYPRWKALNIKIDDCKYMSSKKVPLRLVFKNADPLGADITILYKCGDDLRQDMLTLQVISLMDKLWLNQSLDLHLKPYKVLATGNQAGMLEIVLNSETVNNISEKYGGVWETKTIDAFIKEYNQQSFESKAKKTFARSCAGYCIATYVLGISDRHSSNYMICKNGQFFHIDFGHFLGNWKSKWGIKRERTPLVFTQQMKYAITADSDKLYQQFLFWCQESYNILRKDNRLLLILFRLMIAAGMEELINENDIQYFESALNLDIFDDKKAAKHIEKAIDKALSDWATKVNNQIHLWRHQNKK